MRASPETRILSTGIVKLYVHRGPNEACDGFTSEHSKVGTRKYLTMQRGNAASYPGLELVIYPAETEAEYHVKSNERWSIKQCVQERPYIDEQDPCSMRMLQIPR